MVGANRAQRPGRSRLRAAVRKSPASGCALCNLDAVKGPCTLKLWVTTVIFTLESQAGKAGYDPVTLVT
jgi:hypothetical protein